MYRLIVFALVIAFPIFGKAYAETGNEFLSNCDDYKTGNNYFSNGFCMGYVSGFAKGMMWDDYVVIATKGNNPCRASFTIPDEVTQGQTLDIVLDWLRRNPKSRHFPVDIAILAALIEAFPCP